MRCCKVPPAHAKPLFVSVLYDHVMRLVSFLREPRITKRAGRQRQFSYTARPPPAWALAQVAADIAAKSPLAVWGTKRVLLHTRDGGSTGSGLDYVALHNSAFLLSNDIAEMIKARASKQRPRFAKL